MSSSSPNQDFESELDNYYLLQYSTQQKQKKQQQQQQQTSIQEGQDAAVPFQETTWNFNDGYPDYERYTYDTSTNLWLDSLTNEYSLYDQATQTYLPVTSPQSTHSIRFVVESSPFFQQGQVALVDETGMTIGRDRSWDSRLRLPEMMVSKYHASVFLDKQEKLFYMIDNGSQHGTFVNDKRLSEPKEASLPYELRHDDTIKIGSTRLKIHLHEMGWPCQLCLVNQFIPLQHEKKQQKQQQQQKDQETSRREWIKQAKKDYMTVPRQPNSHGDDDDYVDRAKMRRNNHHTITAKAPLKKQHDTPSQRERKELNQIPAMTYNTPVEGIGNTMLQKLGWAVGTSLGKRNDGILEPINAQAIGGNTSTKKLGLGIPKNESKKQKQSRLTLSRYNNHFS